jgi:hypothetical protein
MPAGLDQDIQFVRKVFRRLAQARGLRRDFGSIQTLGMHAEDLIIHLGLDSNTILVSLTFDGFYEQI